MTSTDGSRKQAVTIRVQILQRQIQIDRGKLQTFAERALHACQVVSARGPKKPELPDEIFVLLISDRRMAKIHQEFLHESGATDVITFQHGEIFISAQTARRHARQFGSTTAREMQLYIVHGLLHLLGFDDRTAVDRRKMRKTESAVFRLISRPH